MSEPEPGPAAQPPKAAAPPRAPGFVETLELALASLADPSVFARAAERPAPSFGACLGFALVAGAASLAINLVHAFVSTPALLQQFSPPFLAAISAVALGLYASVLFVFAALLYGIGNSFGGNGGFERGLQAAAMLSVLGPAQMLCNWFPLAWILPALLAGWAAAGALEGLFKTRPGPARASCAALAAAAIGLQFVGRALVDRARETYAVTQEITRMGGNPDLARSMDAFQRQASALAPAEGGTAPNASAPAATSGLDLLRGMSADGGDGASDAGAVSAGPSAAPAPAAAPPTMAEAAKGLQANAAGMLDALTPMMNALANAKNMTPDQRANIKELQSLLADLKGQLASGTQVDKAAFAQKMMRYQQLMMRVMASNAAAPQSAGSAAGGNQTPHLVLPKDGK